MLIEPILTGLRCGNQLLDLRLPVVMGIINVTPDSFFPPSRIHKNPDNQLEETLKAARRMVDDGAKIIDIGGASSRPGAKEISIDEELNRVIPVIAHLAAALPSAIISVDTYRAVVASEAIRAGATLINDISGGSIEPDILKIVAKNPVGYTLMHMRGTPQTMQKMTDYQDIIGDLLKYFVNKLRHLNDMGIKDVIIDPGFGFAKTTAQNFALVNHVGQFRIFGYPVMIGVSRKSSLSHATGRNAEETLDATTALHMASLLKGVSILRTHDIKPAMDAISIFTKLVESENH